MRELESISSAAAAAVNSALEVLDQGTIEGEISVEALSPRTEFPVQFRVRGHHAGTPFAVDCSGFPLHKEHVAQLTGGRSLSEIDPAAAALVVRLWLEENQGEVDDLVIDSVSFGDDLGTEPAIGGVRIPLRISAEGWSMLVSVSCDGSLDLAALARNFVEPAEQEIPAGMRAELQLELESVMVDEQQLRDLRVGDVIVLSGSAAVMPQE